MSARDPRPSAPHAGEKMNGREGQAPPPRLIRGGRLIDASGLDRETDLLIAGGVIAEIGPGIAPGPGVEVEDARGLLVLPGLCDIHVHLREPGEEDKETVASGAAAAAAGGFTDIACMPNTQPPIDDQSQVKFVIARAQAAGLARVHVIAAVTQGRAGEQLTEMAELQAAGAVAFSDDGFPVRNAEIMRRALEYGRMIDAPIIDHCEDKDLAGVGCMHEGRVSTELGLPGIPAAAEEVLVARDLVLAELTGAHVHLAHLSTRGSVDLVRTAKARGVRVTCEVTPHHLILTDEAVRSYDPVTKMNPPLRSATDVRALRAALADGTIDAIATDHAPHTEHEKELEFDRAPFGVVGLETALGLVLSELVDQGVLDLPGVVRVMSLAPRRILGLPGGTLAAGAPADLVLVDPNAYWAVDPSRFRSRSRNSPFRGFRLRGEVMATVVGGRVVMRRGEELRAGAIAGRGHGGAALEAR
jgi:dihydroorotase